MYTTYPVLYWKIQTHCVAKTKEALDMVSINKLTFAFWVSPPLTSMPSPLCACGQRRLMHVTFFWCGSWARQHDRGHSWSHQKPGNWRGRRRGMPPAPRPFVPVSLKCWSHLIHSSTLILKIFGRDLAQCECLYPSLTNSTLLRTVFFSHTKKTQNKAKQNPIG